jgi:hypothetical protein
LSCLGIIEKAFAHAHLQAIRGWPGEISGLSRRQQSRDEMPDQPITPGVHPE